MAFGDNLKMWSGKMLLDTKWRDDFESGNTDVFHLNLSGLHRITDICINRDDADLDSDW